MQIRRLLVVATLVACSADEGAGLDATLSTTSQGVLDVNDAPVLDASKTPTLGNLSEDAGPPVGFVGFAVTGALDYATDAGGVDNVTDADIGEGEPSSLGIAIIAANTVSGTWHYTIDNGTTWSVLAPGSPSSARLLEATTTNRLYFQPNPNYVGNSTVAYHAWDGTSGSNGGLADTSSNGAATAFSTTFDSAHVFVIGVNDAPVLDSSVSLSLAAIDEDAGVPVGMVGTLVGTLIDLASVGGGVDNVSDVDTNAQVGIAVSGVSSLGTAWFSLDNGTTWSAVGTVSDTTPRVLVTGTTRIYFQPAANVSGTIADAVTFRAWDRTAGVSGAIGNAATTGGSTAYSSTTDTIGITVNPVNDAPVLDDFKSPNFGSVNPDSPAPVGPVGVSLSTVIDSTTPVGGLDNVTDPDGPGSGIALVSTSQTNGTWYYTIDDGETWQLVGTVTASSALLLAADASTRIYFQPNSGYTGGAVSFVRAWDLSTGTNGSFEDTTVNGGTTAFSAATDSVGWMVVANVSPTATNLSAPETYTEDTTRNLTDIVVTDSDVQTIMAELRLSTTAAGTLTTATSGGTTSTYNAGMGLWAAQGPVAEVNALLAAVSFVPAANSSIPFTITTTVADPYTTITGAKSVTATAVSDPPTLSNATTAETYTEDTPLNLVDMVISDVDSTNVAMSITVSSTTAGTLSTGTSGTVTSSFFSGNYWVASGPLANINVLLAGLTFTPAANFNGSFSIHILVDDGISQAAFIADKQFTGTPVHDVPTATNLSQSEEYFEDNTLDLTNIVVSDADGGTISAALTLSDPAAGTLTTATSGAVTSVYNPSTGQWTAVGALADVNVLLASVSFVPAANFNGSISISTGVDDGSTPALSGSKVVTGIPSDDLPTATNTSAAQTYTEDTTLDLTDIIVGDGDGGALTVTLKLSKIAAGALSTATAGTATSTYDAGTGVWTASGPIADLNALLAGVTFVPAPNYSQNFTITTTVTDGVSPFIGVKTITGTPVADAPTATNLSAAETYTEDVPLDLVNIAITDVDSANVTATLTLSNSAAGELSTDTVGGASSTYAAGLWTASGPLLGVNTLLANVVFTPAPGFAGNFTIETGVTDGVTATLTGTKPVTATAINDAPTATNLSAPETLTEDTALDLTDVVISDSDSASVTVTLTLSAATVGQLSVATSGASTSTFASGVWTASGPIADVNALLEGVTFTPPANMVTGFTIATSVSDGVAAAITGSKPITAVAVNDSPVAANDAVTLLAGASIVIDAIANDSDVDGETPTIEIVTQPAHGTSSIDSNRIMYTHDGSLTTEDTLTYLVRDAAGATSNTATITISITPVPVEPQPPGEPDEGGGCGCQSTSTGRSAWVVIVLGAMLLRRRRRPRYAPG